MAKNPDNQTGMLIGRYQLAKRLGRGGMGEVWLATDTQLRRQVALKLLPSAMANNRAYLDDFSYEARASATLEHPHIITIHDFGEYETSDGEIIPYLVMPYVTGGTLGTLIRANNGVLSVQESLHYLKQAALAIDYAHSKQVLHRDIKPTNMLLQDGWLFLADFGIAKVLSGITRRDQTHTGSGTPEYMAPEQIAGHAEPASDRYSLAVIAYQLFTGFLPFHGNTPYETFQRQSTQLPPAPRQFNSSMPLDVENVLMLGLAKRPQDRAPSCTIFVEALEQSWMSRITPTSDTDATQLAPWSRRWMGSPSGVNQPAVSGVHPVHTTGTGLQGAQLQTQAPVINNPGMIAPPPVPPAPPAASATMNRRRLIAAATIGAAVLVGGGAVATILLSQNGGLTKPVSSPTPTPPPGPQKLIAGIPLLSLTGHTEELWVSRWDPTGRYLVTAGNGPDVMLWDITSGLKNSHPHSISKPARKWTIADIDFANVNTSFCWSGDGKMLIFGHSASDKIYVLDAFDSSNVPVAYRNDAAANSGNHLYYDSVCPGPQPNMFTIATSDANIEVWRIGQTHGPINSLSSNLPLAGLALSPIGAQSWSRDGQTLAAFALETMSVPKLLVWPNQTGATAQALDLPQRNVHTLFFRMADTVAWSPTNPAQLLVADGDIAVVWDMQQQKQLYTIGGAGNSTTPGLSALNWSPNGRYIAGSYDVPGDNAKHHLIKPQLHIWDTRQMNSVTSPNIAQAPTLSFGQSGSLQHTQSIIDIQWSPNGRYLATASLDTTAIIWKMDGA